MGTWYFPARCHSCNALVVISRLSIFQYLLLHCCKCYNYTLHMSFQKKKKKRGWKSLLLEEEWCLILRSLIRTRWMRCLANWFFFRTFGWDVSRLNEITGVMSRTNDTTRDVTSTKWSSLLWNLVSSSKKNIVRNRIFVC